MRRILKYLGLAVILLSSGAVGAGVYAWVDDVATVESIPVQVDEPLLTEPQARLLVKTFLHEKILEPSSKLPDICFSTIAEGMKDVFFEGLQTFDIEYLGGGHWFASDEHCALMVNDKTGKVTGP
jgi:hypothetical protein|tara:strand:- start:106 stop:480 length:375 start_codon:yes stop_codon:yes gene_type:complete